MNTLNKWKHWPAFWQLCREHDVCQESDKERLGKSEIYLHFTGYESKNFMNLCNWGYSGFAGKVMLSLVNKGIKRNIEFQLLDLSTYAPKTAPLPIVKPCHRCGESHDEANPPKECFAKIDEDKYKSGHDRLWDWFGLSYASFIVIPRVFAHQMPNEWQYKMAELLEQYMDCVHASDLPTPNVMAKNENGKFEKWPDWLLNYRHPQEEAKKRITTPTEAQNG